MTDIISLQVDGKDVFPQTHKEAIIGLDTIQGGKGDKGEKGDKGDKGEQGTSPFTYKVVGSVIV